MAITITIGGDGDDDLLPFILLTSIIPFILLSVCLIPCGDTLRMAVVIALIFVNAPLLQQGRMTIWNAMLGGTYFVSVFVSASLLLQGRMRMSFMVSLAQLVLCNLMELEMEEVGRGRVGRGRARQGW